MDVLDHSCSKMGFGGKMCLDGTGKFDEEKDDQAVVTTTASREAIERCASQYEAIKGINTRLIDKEIPVVIVSVRKSKKGQVRELHQSLTAHAELEGVKLLLYVEHTVAADDLGIALWRLCNNLDPKRDQTLVQRPSLTQPDKMYSCMGLDGTIKTKELDNFQRDWPNIIVSDATTIQAVDAKWDQLGLGPFLPSPSLKFQSQTYGAEAVVNS
jgi:4-hydroxy-3-polyprenylbenzoate decarboxylase